MAPPSILPAKRKTLREQLEQISEFDDEELQDLMNELEEDCAAAIAFEHHSAKTQSRQNYHPRKDKIDRQCRMCASDDSVTSDDQAKQWSSEKRLEAHMESTFHSGFATWTRRAHRFAEQHERQYPTAEAHYKCHYCPTDNPRWFTTIRLLKGHIEGSDGLSHGTEHDRAKDADGWYDDDFRGGIPKNEPQVKRRKLAKTLGFDEEQPEQREGPEDHATHLGVVHGNFDTGEIPPRFAGVLKAGKPLVTDIPEQFKDKLKTGMPPAITAIPDHLQDMLEIDDSPVGKRAKRYQQ